MFNPYISKEAVYTRIPNDPPPFAFEAAEASTTAEADKTADFQEQKKNAGLAGILQRLKQMDKGDILILLILLLLILEGDNTELVITLGLVLLLSL